MFRVSAIRSTVIFMLQYCLLADDEVEYMLRVVGLRKNQREKRSYQRTASEKRVSSLLKELLIFAVTSKSLEHSRKSLIFSIWSLRDPFCPAFDP